MEKRFIPRKYWWQRRSQIILQVRLADGGWRDANLMDFEHIERKNTEHRHDDWHRRASLGYYFPRGVKVRANDLDINNFVVEFQEPNTGKVWVRSLKNDEMECVWANSLYYSYDVFTKPERTSLTIHGCTYTDYWFIAIGRLELNGHPVSHKFLRSWVRKHGVEHFTINTIGDVRFIGFRDETDAIILYEFRMISEPFRSTCYDSLTIEVPNGIKARPLWTVEMEMLMGRSWSVAAVAWLQENIDNYRVHYTSAMSIMVRAVTFTDRHSATLFYLRFR